MTRARYIVTLLLSASPALCHAVPAPHACNPDQVFQKADGLLKMKHYDEAESALNQLQGCTNLSPIQTFNLGWDYGRAHDSKKALKVFQTVPPDVPDRPTHQYAIALSEFELGNYQGAVDALKGLRAEGLLDASGTNLLGVSYSKLGLYKEAYPILVEELQHNPGDLFAYLNLVTLLADTGNFKNAVEVADQAVVAFPQNPDVLVVRGAANILLGNLDKSHSDFAAAVALSPRQPDAQFLLALSDYKQGNYPNAITELKAALDLGIHDSDLHYLLAECMLKVDPEKLPMPWLNLIGRSRSTANQYRPERCEASCFLRAASPNRQPRILNSHTSWIQRRAAPCITWPERIPHWARPSKPRRCSNN